MRALAKSLLLFLLASFPALAQAPPPVVGRVSVIAGTLAFYGPEDADWSAARVNLPVAPGSWFATDPEARGQIRVGPESIDLAPSTQLDVVALQRGFTQLAVTQGRLGLHIRRLTPNQTAEVDIPRGGIWLLQPGRYDIDSGATDRPTRITVFEGSARFAGPGLDTVIRAGDTLVVTGDATLSGTVERAVPDEFVRWCQAHEYHEPRLAAARRLSPGMTGVEELEAHGRWASVRHYGTVWYPEAVPGDWAPYRDGRWVWIDPWGWNWVEDEPWGFAPFHYGRWARIESRWAWVPGRFVPEPVYAPALVAFIPAPPIETTAPLPVDAGPPVGWFPLAPEEVYWPTYTSDPGYVREVNITNVSITKITNITRIVAARPALTDPPPQLVNQQFANRSAATIVPARVLLASAPVAAAAIAVAPQLLQRAPVSVRPPPAVQHPPVVQASTGPASAAAPNNGVRQGGAASPATSPAGAAVPAPPALANPAHPPAHPNFTQLAPAPRVAARPGAPTPVTLQPNPQPNGKPNAEAHLPPSPESRPPAAAGAPQPRTPAAAGPPAHTPAAPDFAHIGKASPAGAPNAAAPTGAPAIAPPAAVAGAPPTATPAPASATPAHPPGAPDFAHLPRSRVTAAPQHPPGPALPVPGGPPASATAQAPRPPAESTPAAQERPAPGAPAIAKLPPAPEPAHPGPAPSAHAAPTPADAHPPHAAPGIAVAPGAAAADQAAQHRAAAEARTRQEAQQRAAAEAAARQQTAAQQRAAAEVATHQQAATQQRAAAEAAAHQQAAAQQRAAAEAAARQQAAAQQRAAAEAAARQQAAAQQHAAACGHPGQPPCPH